MIKDDAFRRALAQGFNFNTLTRSKISAARTKDIPQLGAYHGWSTQKLFESVSTKIATLKHAATLHSTRKPLPIGGPAHQRVQADGGAGPSHRGMTSWHLRDRLDYKR